MKHQSFCDSEKIEECISVIRSSLWLGADMNSSWFFPESCLLQWEKTEMYFLQHIFCNSVQSLIPTLSTSITLILLFFFIPSLFLCSCQLLKNKIQLRKFKDLIGFSQQFVNQATSNLPDRKEFPGAVLNEKLKHRSKEEQESYTRQKTNKPTNQVGYGKVAFLQGLAKSLTVSLLK